MKHSGTHLQVVILFAIIFSSVNLGTGALNSLHAQTLGRSTTGREVISCFGWGVLFL